MRFRAKFSTLLPVGPPRTAGEEFSLDLPDDHRLIREMSTYDSLEVLSTPRGEVAVTSPVEVVPVAPVVVKAVGETPVPAVAVTHVTPVKPIGVVITRKQPKP